MALIDNQLTVYARQQMALSAQQKEIAELKRQLARKDTYIEQLTDADNKKEKRVKNEEKI